MKKNICDISAKVFFFIKKVSFTFYNTFEKQTYTKSYWVKETYLNLPQHLHLFINPNKNHILGDGAVDPV